MARADRPNRHGGGVALLVRTGINFDVVNPIPTSEATSKGGPQEKSLRGSVWGGTTSYLQAISTANMRVLETKLEDPVVSCYRKSSPT